MEAENVEFLVEARNGLNWPAARNKCPPQFFCHSLQLPLAIRVISAQTLGRFVALKYLSCPVA